MSEAVKKVQELLKLPQELCNTCGKCCRLASFKGGLNLEQIQELANSTTAEPSQIDGAKDFLTIFIPFDSTEDARKVDNEFIDTAISMTGNPDMSFFHCRFIDDNNLCMIHEDRPLLCRMYPIPYSKTIYFNDCGFKEKGIENWKKIEEIILNLEQKEKELR